MLEQEGIGEGEIRLMRNQSYSDRCERSASQIATALNQKRCSLSQTHLPSLRIDRIVNFKTVSNPPMTAEARDANFIAPTRARIEVRTSRPRFLTNWSSGMPTMDF